MCFLLLAFEAHPQYRLIVAANRDEFYQRPTEPASFWKEEECVLAGRDLKAGGTWMGITRTGRFAALTNYRERSSYLPDAPSRGELVKNFLAQKQEPSHYLGLLKTQANHFNGFNLLVGDFNHLYYYSNRFIQPRKLAPGVFGLSNHLLDTPWPKVVRGREALGQLLTEPLISPEDLFAILSDQALAPDNALPDTGIGLEWERLLSPIFIQSPTYGTRSSTVLMVDYDGFCMFLERTYPLPEAKEPPGTRIFTFSLELKMP